jgi:hypothetical protein
LKFLKRNTVFSLKITFLRERLLIKDRKDIERDFKTDIIAGYCRTFVGILSDFPPVFCDTIASASNVSYSLLGSKYKSIMGWFLRGGI